MKTLPCDDPAHCLCLGAGHKCGCDARDILDCECLTCSTCDYFGPDLSVGCYDGDERLLCLARCYPRERRSAERAGVRYVDRA